MTIKRTEKVFETLELSDDQSPVCPRTCQADIEMVPSCGRLHQHHALPFFFSSQPDVPFSGANLPPGSIKSLNELACRLKEPSLLAQLVMSLFSVLIVRQCGSREANLAMCAVDTAGTSWRANMEVGM